MRFLFATLMAVALVGSVSWCQHALTRCVRFDVTRDAHGHGAGHDAEEGGHRYRIELLAGFPAAADPFALADAGEAPARLLVRRGTETLLRRTDDIARGATVAVEGLPFRRERVPLSIRATPSMEAARYPCALRVRLVRDDNALCDEVTLWSGGAGEVISGTVMLDLSPQRARLDRGLQGEES